MNYFGRIDSLQKLRDYQDSQPNTNTTSNWYKRSVIFLRADAEESKIAYIAKRTLAVFIAVVFTISIVGIPFLIKSIKEWNLQENLYTKQVMNRHNSICSKKGLKPFFRYSTEDAGRLIWFSKKGVSYLADYLAEKNKAAYPDCNNLKVCDDLDRFKARLKEIENNPNDIKEAIVLTTYTSKVCDKIDPSKCSSHYDSKHQKHWFPILIEKKNGIMKVMVLDANDQGELELRNTHPNSKKFNSPEMLHATIRSANLTNATLYRTRVNRLFAFQGCSVFSLKDAITFLKTNDYFEWIDKCGKIDRKTKDGSIDKPYVVTNLPVEHMRLSQSLSSVEKYKSANKEENTKDLTQKIDDHCRSLNGKKMNKLVDDRFLKYQEKILSDLESLTKEELDQKSQKRVLA